MRVFCNGFNLYGQLDQRELVLEKFTEVFADNPIRDVCINHSFSALRTNNYLSIYFKNKEKCINNCGKIVQASSNDDRLLFLNDLGKLFKVELITNFDLVHEIPNILNSEDPEEQIINVCCGSKLSVAYSNKGRLFSIPHKLIFENVDIIDIKCGREHCLLLDTFGNVFTFGRGSKDGDLYTWGWNGNGQLGMGKQGDEENYVSVMATPLAVDFSDSQRNAMKVACGNRHTIVLLGE
ncbi:hypothetical protein NQ314_002437 [Rhamnusium bicolor]|uniref:Uncharacterized protein n=1 Tax=Rhamnusium bicolor TaxID=1586634 RepID=A0AAV8ZSA5_9CUCU|nr:hypothetical protein NQ314_002437 [Rhamnusium bicolor]